MLLRELIPYFSGKWRANSKALLHEPTITYQTKAFDAIPSNGSSDPRWKFLFRHM
jgi:hypothetical protein